MLGKRKFIGNSLAMLINRVTQSIATFMLSAAIARSLGADALGQYLLAFSLYYIFVTLASQGLRVFFTRELARNPEEISIYLTNGTFLQTLLSLVAYISLVAVVFIMPYGEDASAVCYLMGLAIFPFALSNVTEAIFQALEKMHLIAVTTVPIYIIRLFIILAAMQLEYGIRSVVLILVASEALILVIQWLCILRFIKPTWKIKSDFLREILLEARTFFVIEGAAVISTRMEIVILSILGSELLLGLYGAVVQLLQPFLIVANSVIMAIFPAMSRSVGREKNEQRRIAENLIEFLMIMALPFMVGILLLGRGLLIFVYGPSFAEAALAFKIASLTLVILPFIRVLSYLLVANGFEKVNLRELTVTTPLAGTIGVFLVAQFQLLGAPAMQVSKSVISGSQYIYATYSRLFALDLRRIFVRPLLVSLLMVPPLWLLKQSNLEFWIVLIVSIGAYVAIVSTIGILLLGGPRVVYAKLSNKG
ncbi:Virulence factor MVIN superfamily [Synechococcus sp. PCC 7335]|uniref:oligosaccharide flippase family protein n=1 Tax=Synechococcus sp. (strain ATCC 29403 / PCC 7335) TaxID=91464 RepID=UPI00017EC047|nr:oligosaccharide flippase family protein [Synechococcus sp. PCC 7335]EDX86239.1 Virulence factor MVIN superfamily [Synechococcus sp. PCC 7335]